MNQLGYKKYGQSQYKMSIHSYSLQNPQRLINHVLQLNKDHNILTLIHLYYMLFISP